MLVMIPGNRYVWPMNKIIKTRLKRNLDTRSVAFFYDRHLKISYDTLPHLTMTFKKLHRYLTHMSLSRVTLCVTAHFDEEFS